MSDLPNSNPCDTIDWSVSTDTDLGGTDQEWEEATNPDDLTTELNSSEAIIDTVGATIYMDAVTGCLKGALAGVTIGHTPHIYINRHIRIRHLSPGAKRRLRKKLGIQ